MGRNKYYIEKHRRVKLGAGGEVAISESVIRERASKDSKYFTKPRVICTYQQEGSWRKKSKEEEGKIALSLAYLRKGVAVAQ